MYNPEISRRVFLQVATIVGVFAVPTAVGLLNSLTETDTQRQCREALERLKPTNTLTVGPDGANVRNDTNADPKEGARIIERLKPGTIIASFATIWGRNTSGDPRKKEEWYCIKTPGNRFGVSAIRNFIKRPSSLSAGK